LGNITGGLWKNSGDVTPPPSLGADAVKALALRFRYSGCSICDANEGSEPTTEKIFRIRLRSYPAEQECRLAAPVFFFFLSLVDIKLPV